MIESSYLILTGAVLCVALLLLVALRPYIAAAKACADACPPDIEPADQCPEVSVIVYSGSDPDTIRTTVAKILEQDYPRFEIIVVCDGPQELAGDLGDMLQSDSKRIYVTYIQPGSHNLSRRKLALTIGMKAARGEVVVITSDNISIPSQSWLSAMAEPFIGEAGRHIDVSLGVTHINFPELRGPLKWYHQFDALLTDALWIGYAAQGQPYRGDGYNLAFRRKTFFDHKGFAKTINLHTGDDDLFVNEIANGANTRLVCWPGAHITLNWGASANRVLSIRKAAYSFTSRWLPKTPFIRSGTAMLLQWIIPALCIWGALINWLNPIAAAAALILLTTWGAEIYFYRKLAKAYGAVRLWWGVMPFWLWRPIGDLFFRMEHRHSRKKHFTWQR